MRPLRNPRSLLSAPRAGMFSLAVCAALGLTACGESGAGTSDYPVRAVELVNPWAAGGSHDAHAQAIAAEIQPALGQPMTVSVQSGGAGSVGATAVAKQAKPDGYTLLLGDQTSVIARPLVEELPYSWEDFRPVVQINQSPVLLVVPADSPFETVQDFVDAAEENPGAVSYGSVAGFGPDQIPIELLIQEAGIEVNHVPFDGGGTSYRAVLAGDVDMAPLFPAAVASDLEEGRLRALAVTSSERYEELPDLPTLSESGYDVHWEMFRTIFAPKETPDEEIETLEDVFIELMSDDGFLDIIDGLGEQVEPLTGEELNERIAADVEALEALVEDLG